jgi:hypothetical protein
MALSPQQRYPYFWPTFWVLLACDREAIFDNLTINGQFIFEKFMVAIRETVSSSGKRPVRLQEGIAGVLVFENFVF